MSRKQTSGPISPIVRELAKLRAKDDNEEDLTNEEIERWRRLSQQRAQEMWDSVPKLECCEDARYSFTVRYRFNLSPDEFSWVSGWYVEEYEGFRREHPNPEWAYALTQLERRPLVKFCPFCGTKTPSVRLKADPPPDVRKSSDGNYCDSCGERLNYCQCLRPEAAYEAVR